MLFMALKLPAKWSLACRFHHGVLPVWMHKELHHYRRVYAGPTEEQVRADEQIDRPVYMTGMVQPSLGTAFLAYAGTKTPW